MNNMVMIDGMLYRIAEMYKDSIVEYIEDRDEEAMTRLNEAFYIIYGIGLSGSSKEYILESFGKSLLLVLEEGSAFNGEDC